MAAQVTVNGLVVSKVGTLVKRSQSIQLISGPKYVSRGGEKLEGALLDFNVSPSGLVCLDVGSSTGGFTDCLLQGGAVKVFSIDVGTAQMDSNLKTNPKIVLMEETHINDVEPGSLQPQPVFTVIDVSFISLTKVLNRVKQLVAPGAVVLAMVKPQFEVGPKFLKKGVVQLEEIRVKAVNDVKDFAEKNGFTYLAQTPAKIKGPKGNQEYFLHLVSRHSRESGNPVLKPAS